MSDLSPPLLLGLKAVHLGLRQVGQAPEQRALRTLARKSVDGDGPIVLFLTPRNWAPHVAYESVLAHALRRRGARIRFLRCGGGLELCDRANCYEAPPMPCRTCSSYVEATLEGQRFPTRALAYGEAGDDADWPELDALPIEALSSVEHDGLPLGQLVDIPLKWFLCAADLGDDPLAGQSARAMLRSARRVASALTAELDRERPDHVVLLNGLFLFESIALELCRRRGIDAVTYERGFLRNSLVFSRGAPAGHYAIPSGLMRPLEPAEDAELSAYLDGRRGGQGFDQHWAFTERRSTQGRAGTVVIFTNLTWDTAVLARDLGFTGIRSWLDAILEVAVARPDVHFVVRVHPSERHLPGMRTRDSLFDYLQSDAVVLPANVEVVSPDDLRSSYRLIEDADVGVVYTSTIGLEMATMGRPVIVCGDVHYRGRGFTHDIDDAVDLGPMIDDVLGGLGPPADAAELARRYCHLFFYRWPIHMPGVTEHQRGLVRVDVDDLADLDAGADAGLDRICSMILEGETTPD